MNNPIVLARFGYRHEAETCLGLLQSNDIPAVLFADDAGAMEAGLSFSNPCRIIVPRSFRDEAADLLNELGYSPHVVATETQQ